MRAMVKAIMFVWFAVYCQQVNANQLIDFARSSEFKQIKLSPDGKTLAATVIGEDGPTLAFFNLEDLTPKGKISFNRKKEPGSFYWVNNERVVFKLLHRVPWRETPAYYGQLYAIDQNGKKPKLIYGYNAGEMQIGSRAKKRRKSTSGWADIIDLLPNDPEHILVKSTGYSSDASSKPKAILLNVYSGIIKSTVAYAPVPNADMFTDSNGVIRLAVGLDEKNKKQAYRLDENSSKWIEFNQGKYGEKFSPLAMSSDDTSLYALDDYNADRSGFYKIDIHTGKRTLMFRDKTVDITSALLTADHHDVLAIRFDPDYPNYALVPGKSKEHKIFRNMLATFPGQIIEITSRSRDGVLSIISVRGDRNPGTYYLYDTKQNKLKKLFKRLEHIDESKLASMSSIKYLSEDGIEISGYLTLPNSKQKTDLPLVVLPHGGPHFVRDTWEYNSEVQALANEGFAVLQVNFRGSEGYGTKFHESGFMQWGNLIQKDIIQGVKWSIKQNIADPERVCIMGASFGAYSAVQSATIEQDMFKCVVANVGVYDLEMLYEDGDIKDIYGGESYLNDVIGDNMEQLKIYSPVNHVKRLKANVFIAHGEKDRRAPIEHAEALKSALEQINKPYEWFVKETEGHGFYSDRNRAEYMTKVAEFLHENIGESISD